MTTDLRHQVPPSDESYPLKAQVPPDRVFGAEIGGHWHFDDNPDNLGQPDDWVPNHFWITANPAREKAEELVEALRKTADALNVMLGRSLCPPFVLDAMNEADRRLASLEPKP